MTRDWCVRQGLAVLKMAPFDSGDEFFVQRIHAGTLGFADGWEEHETTLICLATFM